MELQSSSLMKLTVQIQLALHPCDLFLINNNTAGNSAEQHCYIALNVKLQVKLDSKGFIDF